MRQCWMADEVRYRKMSSEELRETFLLRGMFRPGGLEMAYVDLDRAVVGAAVPTDEPLVLEAAAELRADFFCERRELGVLNLGGKGTVSVDGDELELERLDCLYVGRGAREVSFMSADAQQPAAFYLLSYPAHASFPTTRVRFGETEPVRLGASETANRRALYKAIWTGGVRSCQLVMGFTLLESGSVWNTMPPHTHSRRSEIYCYFDVNPAHRVMHLMGPPEATNHLIVGNREVVVSPGWSIHAGVGTQSYGFCWGMGGENQAFDDMDPVAIVELL